MSAAANRRSDGRQFASSWRRSTRMAWGLGIGKDCAAAGRPFFFPAVPPGVRLLAARAEANARRPTRLARRADQCRTLRLEQQAGHHEVQVAAVRALSPGSRPDPKLQ